MCCIVCRVLPWGWGRSVCLSARRTLLLQEPCCELGALVVPLVSQGSDSPFTGRLPWPGWS